MQSEKRWEHTVEQGMFLRRRAAHVPGSSLLFIHGLGESGLCFEALADREELEPYELLVPDLPGYGRSAWPEAPYALDEAAENLARWLVERGTEGVVLVGHSMGGVIAQLMARNHPELVGALVNVDGNLSAGDCVFSGRAASFELGEFATQGFDDVREGIYQQGTDDRALRGYYASLRLADPRVFHAHSLGLVELSRTEKLALDLAKLALPKLYIAGSPDGASPRSLQLLEQAGAPWVSVAPSGHWPFIDNPRTFTRELVAFLRESISPGKGAGS